MKKLIGAVMLVASTTAGAHSFQNNTCDVELNAGVKINSNVIEFSKNNTVLYSIAGEHNLIVDGKSVDLNHAQEQMVSQYTQRIRSIVPEVKGVALKGIALATEGVNLAFNELLGEGNQVGADLTLELEKISDEVQTRLSIEKGISFNEDGIVGDDFFDDEFEQRIEDAVERTVKKSMGSLLMAVGQEMLMAGGDMDAFEARMENFGEQIENEMESRGEALEADVNKLCGSITEIEALESTLQKEIDELADIDALTVTARTRQ